jgi:outer membrane protein OmpA-like peptidoglycan-associated protein
MTIKRLESATESLSKLDISGLVTSMALGIAEAQKQLDDNSIAQTLILANPDLGLNGVSLLELGFVPSFYQFQYVDLSANMSLKVSSSFETEVSLSIAISNSGDRSKIKNKEIIKSGEDSEYRREYEGSNSLVVKHSADTNFQVGESQKLVKMDKSKGAYTRKHKMAESIREVAEVDRVTFDTFAANESVVNGSAAHVVVSYLEGTLTFAIPPKEDLDNLAIFKVGEHDSTTVGKVALPSDPFTVGASEDATLITIATAVGSSGAVQVWSGDHYKDIVSPYGPTDIAESEIRIHFDFDSPKFDSGLVVDGYDNQVNLSTVEILARILKNDSAATVEVVGHTDKVGSVSYNERLSRQRAQAVIAEMISPKYGVNRAQLVEKGAGETEASGSESKVATNNVDRYVSVRFVNSDSYYILEQGDLIADETNAVIVTPNSSGLNDYILRHQDTAAGTYDVDATVTNGDGAAVSLSGSVTVIDVTQIQALTGYSDLVAAGYEGIEIRNNKCYLLNEKTKFRYTALSKSKEKIDIKVAGSESSESESSTVENEEYAIGESQSTNSYSRKDAKELKSDSVWQLDASLDARVASRFSFSIEGNSSMSARLVALPAPAAFLDLVIIETSTETG